MRVTSCRAILILVALMLFSVVMVSHAAAMRYIGQITWTAEQTEDETGPITPVTFPMTVGISQMGGPYYIVQGIVNLPSGAPVILSGGGQIVGSDLVLTMTCCRDDVSVSWFSGSSLYAKVDKTSLNGIFKVINNNFNTSSHSFDSSYVAGNLTTSTPISLTAGAPSLILLLLDQ
jgi:hypothetical protein